MSDNPRASAYPAALEFIDMIGKAFREPIKAMLHQIDTLKTMNGVLPPEGKAQLKALTATGKQLNHLMNELVHFSSATTDRSSTSEDGAVNVKALIDAVQTELRSHADEALVTIQILIPDKIQDLQTNEVVLHTALYHLVLNTIMFNLPGGFVRIEAYAEQTNLVIRATDTGTAIPAEEWGTIFQSPNQGEAGSTRKAYSRGLGLPIARRAIAQIDGTLEIETSGKDGTTFVMQAPMIYKDPEAQLEEMRTDLGRTHKQSLAYAHDLRQVYKRFRAVNKQLEAANRRLEEADSLKSNFLAVVSHELRSPVSTLEMSIQTFARYGLTQLVEEQQKLFEQISKGTRDARRMIDQLVKAADLLSHQHALTFEELDLSAIAMEVEGSAIPLAMRRSLQMTLDVPPRLVIPKGDRRLILDALWNLVDNALKFTPHGGKVGIRAYSFEGRAILEVSDTGPGIAKELQTGLWEAFSQLNDPLRRGVEGLGLGLALVRFAAHAHDGDVLLQSEPGLGSVFGFWIPLQGTYEAEE